MTSAEHSDVVVAGAGASGLAAAVALAEAGAKVILLERRPYIGGRAYSYDHPALEETVDSQHVVLGCCTNILDLCQRAGMVDAIRWYDELTFLEPNGRRSLMRSGRLPAPAHQAMSFLRAPMLNMRDKAAIARGMAHFLRGYPTTDDESFAVWLKQTGQTERAIRHFWEPVVVGALNDGFERCSVKYAGKVFHESFLRSSEAGLLGIPAAPLSDFFAPIAQMAERLGVRVKLKTGVERIEQGTDGRWSIFSGGERFTAGSVVLATDFKQTRALLARLPNHTAEAEALSNSFDRFIAAPITTIHLWYDRDVTDLDHAVLLDTRIQWMFGKSRIRRWPAARGSYLELVISASWPELEMGREEILASALRETELFFPAIRHATLMKSGVLKEARATFSVTPGLDRFRPEQTTAWPGVYLAGDWTRTEWPSTMEGAVRSGRLAAGAVVNDPRRFMAKETPASGMMRWLSRAFR
ncbi:hydroxysqualene dehydroxylase HpnE [Edaphobacter sp.]|uniref:hydroxysqualene dehydroxylase HpnE n=1 Tax=Edaphobacter sp. TaxID=1934404 RepID=UPI002DBD1D6E|nr:hydroxysqualene dehydroxylase HpnE [Edaphobacter sp.]HEU5341396.1 hydroxysqualene dehydroxylase HpnE [Edaphobacter sp.]